MKLGSLKSKMKSLSRDGELIVVSSDNTSGVRATGIANSLREAIEDWGNAKPKLQELSENLNSGKAKGIFRIDEAQLHSAMPRAFQWVDGSAYIHHVKLVRLARKAPLPETLETVPLMYQGGSDDFLAPREDIPQLDPKHGTDFEGEVAVVVDDVPMGISPEDALKKILLFMIVNDVSLRGLIPEELASGFGFFQSKPSSAFAPFAVTEDELKGAWKNGRIHLPLSVKLNDQFFGNADAGKMHFHFGQLIAHAARTRNLKAGTVIGSGTVSNDDSKVGSSCLVERRMIETIESGEAKTPFMKVGDVVQIEMFDKDGQNIFGSIRQKVAKANAAQ